MALLNFDATTVEPNASLSVVPAGEYLGCIVDSQVKSTKAGNGQFLELVFEIVHGEHQGRKIWQRINFKNPNPKAEAVAKRELANLCKALGILHVQHSEVLHNIPLMVQIEVEEGSNGYGPSNRIKSYSPGKGKTQTSVGAEGAITTTAADATVPVWKRKSA